MAERLFTQRLVEMFARRSHLTTEQAERFCKEFFALIEEGLQRDRYVKIPGFGVFKLIAIEPRESINVNTGERFTIEGHNKVSFTPETALRDLINKPFAHFQTVVLNDETVLPKETDTDTAVDTEEAEEYKVEEEIKKEKAEEVKEEEQEEEVVKEEKAEDVKEVEEAAPVKAATPPSGKSQSTLKYFITMVIIIILLCGGALLYLYWDDISQHLTQPPTPAAVQVSPPADAPSPELVADTLTDDTLAADTIGVSPFPIDSTSYIITGTRTTHRVRYGETLTRISLRYYGEKGLYPYIVKHNPRHIKDPNRLTYDIVLQIPELKKK
ncbi:MAG: HU family DNA-binding protein [Prevotellaceae bacterium]|jgi:nucleoid DNA-binding protein/nucleoid-associated protein YgaU|nr:HU family DNA-binding protein [Prevotellaceae bacterium]